MSGPARLKIVYFPDLPRLKLPRCESDKHSMKPLILFILFTAIFATITAFAQDISVVDVKRNITLADEDTVYRDYYISAGEGSALRKNLVVTVKRKINIKDAGTKSVGDFDAVVGQLKVIQVGNKVSVAREFKLLSRDEAPMLEQTGIMTGDKVDLNGSFIDNSKPNYKRKTSEAEPLPKDEKTAAVVPPIVPASENSAVVAPKVPASEKAETTASAAVIVPVVEKPAIVPASENRVPAAAIVPASGKIVPASGKSTSLR